MALRVFPLIVMADEMDQAAVKGSLSLSIYVPPDSKQMQRGFIELCSIQYDYVPGDPSSSLHLKVFRLWFWQSSNLVVLMSPWSTLLENLSQGIAISCFLAYFSKTAK